MELQIFKNEEFGEIRTVAIKNEPYFVGRDVAQVLGYKDTSDALKRHVDEEDKLTRCFTDSGQTREMYVINESGLYSLILSSKLPTAKKFKRWVTSEVLPSIRKNGGYIAGQETLSDDELLAKALQVAQRKIAERDELIAKKQERIEEMRPKEVFADAVASSYNSILIRDLAKILKQNGVDTGEKRLYKWMRQHGYICKNSTDPTQRAMEQGLFEIRESTVVTAVGSRVTKTTKVTGKGQQFFVSKFLESGVS